MSRIQHFVQEVWQELKKVNWPTPRQARTLTVMVLAVSAAVSVYIAIFDYVFGVIAKTINAG